MAIVAERSVPESNALMRMAQALLSFATRTYLRFAAAAGALILAAYIALSAASVVISPEANWDLLPYIAAAAESRQPDAQAVQAFAYDAVREGVGNAAFEPLAHGDAFREAMSSNAGNFVSLLGMYRVKFLYVKTLSALFGVLQPVDAVRAVSILSTLGFGLVAFLWLRWQKALALSPLFVGLLIVAGFGDAARVGTPDMFCAALLIGGVYAFVRKAEALSALLLFLAFLARPDNVVFLVLLALLIGISRLKAPGALAAFAAALAAYFAVSHWAGHPGWWPHLVFSTLFQAQNMATFHPDFSAIQYLKAAGKAVYFGIEHNSWVGVTLLALGAWLAPHLSGFRMGRREGVMFAALGLSLAAKFVVFPIHDTRVYVPALLPMLLLAFGPLQAFGAAAFQARRSLSGERA